MMGTATTQAFSNTGLLDFLLLSLFSLVVFFLVPRFFTGFFSSSISFTPNISSHFPRTDGILAPISVLQKGSCHF